MPLFAACLLSSLPAVADETKAAVPDEPDLDAPQRLPERLSLMHPGTLTGWQYGDAEPSGWTVKDRTFSASKDASRFISEWTFGDFEVKFEWQTSKDGLFNLELLNAQDRELKDGDNHLRIPIGAQSGCGAIIAGGKKLAKGLEKAPAAEETHTIEIRRKGSSLAVFINNQGGANAAAAEIEADRRFRFAFHVVEGDAAIEELQVTLPLGEPLFNGKDLTGWWSQRKQDGWKVEDGELVGQGKGGNYLRSEREFGDFALSFDYKIKPGGNSGVGIRTPREGWPSGQGMELQILDRPGEGAGSQMSIYKHFPPLARPDKSGEWNHVLIKAEGRLVTAWVNGQIAQHADTSTKPATADKPLRGWVGFQDHGAKTQIRSVYLLQSGEVANDIEP